jgi:hypothetical protein
MVVNNFHSITEVLPAIIGFSIAGILILKSVFSVKIPQYNENPPGVLISSFIFIVSGFLFEIIYICWPSIQCWAKNNSNIAFLFTIVGGFCTNGFLKKLADDKEKREISVLFRNSINSQVKSLQFIQGYLNSNPNPVYVETHRFFNGEYSRFRHISLTSMKENIQYLKIYKNNLLTSKAYDTALNKIGIYDEKDIDRISEYSNELQQCFNYIERLLTKLDEYKVDQGEYKHEDKLILTIVKNTILTTSLSGINIIYHLSKRYLGKLQNELFNDYEEILDDFTKELSNSQFNRMNEGIFSDLFNKLKYIRDNFIETNNNYNISSRKPIYIYRVIIRKPVLTWNNIVTFGESPEDAKNNCNSIIETLKNEHNPEIEIQDSNPICEIISPWK